MSDRVPFNRPATSTRERAYVEQVLQSRRMSGDGPFTRRCQELLQAEIGCRKAFLVHSCTAGLEMAAILSQVGPGDEVIMPSFTFVSTANAFVLRGAVPVFVDVRPDTLNLDEKLLEAAITPRTRAIVPVHYAGVGCNMGAIMEIAERHDLIVIEDAAQGYHATIDGRPLGSIGHLAALSFHETKNVVSGEGGALLVNDERFVERAEIIREKGTDRVAFFQGRVDKYTWCDVGSSYLPSELIAAVLLAQLEDGMLFTQRRRLAWESYYAGFADLESSGLVRRPTVPQQAQANGHIFYLMIQRASDRPAILKKMAQYGVDAVFHYVPLHSAPAGRRFGRAHGDLAVTDDLAARLVRLPLWPDLSPSDIERVIDGTSRAILEAAA